MGLEEAICHKKEHRRPYRGSKRFDATCRNHGACPWCRRNRLRGEERRRRAAEEQISEWTEQR
jgi:hypothetical protein